MTQAANRRESRIVENVPAQATEFPTEGEDRNYLAPAGSLTPRAPWLETAKRNVQIDARPP